MEHRETDRCRRGKGEQGTARAGKRRGRERLQRSWMKNERPQHNEHFRNWMMKERKWREDRSLIPLGLCHKALRLQEFARPTQVSETSRARWSKITGGPNKREAEVRPWREREKWSPSSVQSMHDFFYSGEWITAQFPTSTSHTHTHTQCIQQSP